MSIDTPTSLSSCYNPDTFRSVGHQLIDLLADYLSKMLHQDVPVVRWQSPEAQLKIWQTEFKGIGEKDFLALVERYLENSMHLHHPHFVGHQMAPPLPLASLSDLVISMLNNSNAIYEMSPVGTMMERILVRWMADELGLCADADGFFTAGGSLGNLTALLCARQNATGRNVWEEGHSEKPLAVLVSGQSHYSITRAVQMMGLGKAGIIEVGWNDRFQLEPRSLQKAFEDATAQGKQIFAMVANAGSTATGSYDPLPEIGDFCRKHSLWLHVDAAHGASAALSPKHRHLLKGIEHADSLVWDAHKLLMMPNLTTAVIFKSAKSSYATFAQKAGYLFEKSASEEEWFNLSHRTFECTKRNFALRLYLTLSVYGKAPFTEYIENVWDKAKQFAQMIEADPDFELATQPQSNIVCFRFKDSQLSGSSLDDLQSEIRKSLFMNGDFYLVQTRLPAGLYLRTTLMNPFTTPAHLKELLGLLSEKARARVKTP